MRSTDVYWVSGIEPHRLGFGPRPRAGDWLSDEIAGWSRPGIRHVVSLLEDHEVHELGMAEEARLCAANGITFHAFPIPDRGVPSSINEAGMLFRRVASLVVAGEPTYIHCRAGIGRSGLVAAGVLAHLGVPLESAFAMLSSARGMQIPDTQSQIDWAHSYAAAQHGVRRQMIDRGRLYELWEDFFALQGSAVMRLSSAAVVDVCSRAAKAGLVVARIEGGIWLAPGFESRLDCIWDGADPPLSQEDAHLNNLEAAAFIDSQAGVHGAFILTTLPITGWRHEAARAAV